MAVAANPRTMADIFISYAREDSEVARRLALELGVACLVSVLRSSSSRRSPLRGIHQSR